MAAAAAGAATFNLGGLSAGEIASGLTVDGLSLNFAASAVGTGVTSAVPVSVGVGMGVTTSPVPTFDDQGSDANRLDGRVADETLSFLFNQRIVVDAITFQGINPPVVGPSNDDVRLVLDGDEAGGFTINIPRLDANSNVTRLTEFDGVLLVLTQLDLSAIGNNDRFRVQSIEVSQVPLPGALGLALTGIAALALMRRRRS